MRKVKNPIKIEFKDLTNFGYAYHDERRIEIKTGLRQDMLLKVAVHEVIHVELPDLDESAVLRVEKSVADVLWRIGFRKAKDAD
jgi:hypothetical protein